MADGESPNGTNYASNSMKKKSSTPDSRPEVKAVVSGKVVQKNASIGKKFREAFSGDSADTVGRYILFDVVIPAAKDLINDMVSKGIHRLLYGGVAPRSSSSSVLVGGRTNYSGMASKVISAGQTQSRVVPDFKSIVIEDRGEAEMVIDTLIELCDTFGSAKVADLYAAVGMSSEFTDQAYGWTDLGSARAVHTREGYLLDMPTPIHLP